MFTNAELAVAANLVISNQYAGTVFVGRVLGIRHHRAAAILSRLAELGIVNPSVGHYGRAVLVKPYQREQAVAAVAAGQRYVLPARVGRDAIDPAQVADAIRLVHSALPDVVTREEAARVVGLLADAGWGPLPTVAGREPG